MTCLHLKTHDFFTFEKIINHCIIIIIMKVEWDQTDFMLSIKRDIHNMIIAKIYS